MLTRRNILLAAASLPLTSCKVSFEHGMKNPCKSPKQIPAAHVESQWVTDAWRGINAENVWDAHAHLYGDGDSGSGLWLHPDMSAETGTLQGRIQRTGYLNAGCVIDVNGRRDASMRERLTLLLDAMPRGVKSLVFAFDYTHNKQGARVLAHSTFYVPDAYARDVARSRPDRFEWVASIHPYRADALDALAQAKESGARAVKWLPAAQGMDPSDAICKPYYRALVKHNVPLIVHAGKELAVKGPDTQALGNPLRLRAALDEGVRVIVAHCASLGTDIDLDAGENGPEVDAFALFARLFDTPRFDKLLFADLSAVAQMNRMDVLPTLLRRTDWHARLLNGSDYPLPGVMPLYSLNKLVEAGLLDAQAVPTLRVLREHHSLLFDFVLKRSLALNGKSFAPSVFETKRFFGG
jgi:uncharacterized protein